MAAPIRAASSIMDTESRRISGSLTMRSEVAAVSRLKGVRAAIQPLVAAGKTADEVVAAKPTARFDEAWGNGFLKPEQFQRIVYASLKGLKK